MLGARFVLNQSITMSLIVNAVHCITTSIACVKRIPECKNGWSYPLVRVAPSTAYLLIIKLKLIAPVPYSRDTREAHLSGWLSGLNPSNKWSSITVTNYFPSRLDLNTQTSHVLDHNIGSRTHDCERKK